MTRPLRLLIALVFALTAAVGLRATLGPTQQMLLGNPSSAGTDPNNHVKYLIQRAQYALDYSDSLREPNWVAWNLTTSDTGGSGRSDDFFVDTTLPPTFTPVLTTGYQGSGYDRGHMCPSGDRTIDRANNDVTFYMSNMVPQAPDNNQGVWGNFESYCRTLASAGNEVLIISGPSGFAGSAIASGVAIPGYVWKVVVVVPLGAGSAVDRINAGTRVIAIKIPNIQGVRSDPWQNYITSASVIEADTGYTFFTELSAPLAATLRAKVDGQTALGAPAIVDQPVAQTTVVGGSVTFTISATGNAPLSYQWYKDDAEVAGATSASLTIASAQAADMGNYYAVVTNNVGLATSNAAALIISGLPPVISTPPQAQTVSAGGSVTFAVVATGSPTLTYQWHKAGAPISGATQASYTLNNAQAADAVAYDVVVTNSVNSVTSASALLTVAPAAPTIVNHPVTQTATGGTVVTLSVVARGTEPLSYQWRKGGVPLANGGIVSGALTSTLTLTGVSGDNAGSYDVFVSNGIGSATSNAATLTVNAATIVWTFGPDAAGATANPTSGLPIDITGGTVSQGNNNGTTTMVTNSSVSPTSTMSGGNNAGAAARIGAINKAAGGSAYFEFTLDPADGKKLVVTSIAFGSRSTGTGPAAYGIYSDFDGYTTALATGTLATTSSWALINPASFTSVTGTTGAPVTFRIYGYGGAGSPASGTANWRIDDLKVSVSTITASAAVAPAVIATTPTNGTIGAATSTPVTVTFNQPVQIAGPWFSIASAANGPLTATVTGGPTTYTLTPPTSFPYGDTITVTILAGQVIEKDTGTVALPANYAFSFGTGLPVAPAIVTAPVARVVADGGSTTFSVTASGTAPLTYVWRKGGVAITGNPSASTATLALTAVSAADQGNYSVVISNAAGSVTSDEVSLTVTAVAPAIVMQPASTTVSTGTTATLSVGATGTGPLAYQWSKGGVALADGPGIAGATTALLTLSNASAATAGSYEVVVSNVVTSVTSQPATVGVTSATLAVATWDFTTADPTTPLPAGVTGGTVMQGNNNGTTALLTNTSASGSGFSGGNNAGAAARIGALNQANGGSAYFELTLTPATSAHRIVATDISFGSRSTGTGPQAFSVFSSVDGYTTALATGTLAANSAWALKDPVFSGVRGLAGVPVTLRIYGHSGTGSPGSGTANWRIDDLKLTLGAELLPAIASTSPAAGATGVALNAPVTITFNQPVTAGPGAFAATSALSGAVSTTVTGGPTTYTVTPNATWFYNNTVTVNVIASHIVDASGTLGMPANASFSFSTLPMVAPAIVTPPVAQTATVGGSVSFTVVASGTAPLEYLWRKAGTPITGNASAQTATLTLTGVAMADSGLYDVIVSNPGGDVTSDAAQLTVSKAPAAVALAGLSTVYDGTPRVVTATTTPAGLAVQFTYDGSATAPVAVGSYAVVATIVDANYAGSASGTLSVAKASASIALSGLNANYDGTPKSVTATTTPAGLPVTITYNGSATPPSAAGSYAVSATINHASYTGSASGTLVIGQGNATIVLSGLSQLYDGTPRVVTATTTPAGLDVIITYGSGLTPPTAPGAYAVVATIDDDNYTGTVSGTLIVTTPVIVRHAPTMNGGLDGSMHVLLPESFTLNGNAWVSGDMFVPGLPTVRLNGNPTYAGTRDGTGAATPTNYTITLNGGAVARYIVRRTDAIVLPTVAPVPSSNNNVTLNGNGALQALAPGNYGQLIANGNRGFILGVAGATTPAVYNVQSLILNGGTKLEVVGPVILNVSNSLSLNGNVGSSTNPAWLALSVYSGGVTLNGNVKLYGSVLAPNGTVIVNGNSVLKGAVTADRLTINGNGLVDTKP